MNILLKQNDRFFGLKDLHNFGKQSWSRHPKSLNSTRISPRKYRPPAIPVFSTCHGRIGLVCVCVSHLGINHHCGFTWVHETMKTPAKKKSMNYDEIDEFPNDSLTNPMKWSPCWLQSAPVKRPTPWRIEPRPETRHGPSCNKCYTIICYCNI